ncbi:hypothetical protein DBT_1368 [Dissulfuribacter thermophilus]|uniref:Uncharacterized protein n=1 Tax=Dissulfuribacter thermophilus TaxID=1156395 RepID=A0A1B9F606_9BACT|nr:hypothetical protein DBT_1368 [Dissulfuribacter thermophilus]
MLSFELKEEKRGKGRPTGRFLKDFTNDFDGVLFLPSFCRAVFRFYDYPQRFSWSS